MAGAAVDDVELVVVGERVQDVVAGSAVLGVGTATDPHHVVAFAAVLDVFAVAALDGVVPAISVDDVVAGSAVQAVVAGLAVDHVGSRRAVDDVGAGCADEHGLGRSHGCAEHETAGRQDSECAVLALHVIHLRRVANESLTSVLDESQRRVGAVQGVSQLAVKRVAVGGGFTA